MSGWVRIVIIGPDMSRLGERDLQDCWYAAGCYQHPNHHQGARDQLATAELHEWLNRRPVTPGTYVISVTELNARHEQTGRIWAQVKVTQRACPSAAA